MRRKRLTVYRQQPESSTALGAGKEVRFAANLGSGRGTVPSAGNPPLLLYPVDSRSHAVSSHFLRRWIVLLTELNAVIAAGTSFLACEVSICENAVTRETLKGGLCVLSLGQVVLIVLYWYRLRQWLESLRQELRLSSVSIPPLHHSPSSLCTCLFECFLHLLVPPPYFSVSWKVDMQGSYSFLTLDKVLCVLILLRNYHFLRYLSWKSVLTTRRAFMTTLLAGVRVTNSSFCVRYGFAVYPFRCIFGLYAVSILISGFSTYLFGVERPGSDLYTVYNGVWIAAHTQAAIGYEEFPFNTYFSCFALIISCLIGTLALSLIVTLAVRSLSLTLSESSLYTALAYRDFKHIYRREAAVLIQRWWRFQGTRIHHTISGKAVWNYYEKLGRYRRILRAGEQTKYTRFEEQLRVFQDHITREFYHMTEYLQPILRSGVLISSQQTSNLLQFQSQIQEKCQFISKSSLLLVTRPYIKLPASSFFSARCRVLMDESRSVTFPHSNRGEMARAREELIGRLLKGE